MLRLGQEELLLRLGRAWTAIEGVARQPRGQSRQLDKVLSKTLALWRRSGMPCIARILAETTQRQLPRIRRQCLATLTTLYRWPEQLALLVLEYTVTLRPRRRTVQIQASLGAMRLSVDVLRPASVVRQNRGFVLSASDHRKLWRVVRQHPRDVRDSDWVVFVDPAMPSVSCRCLVAYLINGDARLIPVRAAAGVWQTIVARVHRLDRWRPLQQLVRSLGLVSLELEGGLGGDLRLLYHFLASIPIGVGGEMAQTGRTAIRFDLDREKRSWHVPDRPGWHVAFWAWEFAFFGRPHQSPQLTAADLAPEAADQSPVSSIRPMEWPDDADALHVLRELEAAVDGDDLDPEDHDDDLPTTPLRVFVDGRVDSDSTGNGRRVCIGHIGLIRLSDIVECDESCATRAHIR